VESANRIWHIQGESLKKKAKYLIVLVVFLATKTVTLREDAKNCGETKSNPVTNAMTCPVRTLTVWIAVTEDVMV